MELTIGYYINKNGHSIEVLHIGKNDSCFVRCGKTNTEFCMTKKYISSYYVKDNGVIFYDVIYAAVRLNGTPRYKNPCRGMYTEAQLEEKKETYKKTQEQLIVLKKEKIGVFDKSLFTGDL